MAINGGSMVGLGISAGLSKHEDDQVRPWAISWIVAEKGCPALALAHGFCTRTFPTLVLSL